MNTPQFDRIKKDLLAKHGSLEIPDFHFRWEAIETRPYRGFVDEALTHFYMKDSTDLNQDGCFVYLLLKDSNPQWMVQLSMVGRYGVVFRIEGSRILLLDESDTNRTVEETVILQLVRKHEIALLDEATLTEPVALKMDYTDQENVCIYQALFSDTDRLPWKSKEA